MSVDLEQTIVAVASAAGNGARAIVRLSGPDAVAVAFGLLEQPPVPPSKAWVLPVQIPLSAQRRLPADLWIWPTARSYTRQPQVEIHMPGSRVLGDTVLARLLDLGARLARPGEFTLRAFLAGRLDLTQAEAVLGIIDATAESRLDASLRQLAGGLSGPLQRARVELVELLALLEAGLDFAEEDIEFITSEELAERIAAIGTSLEGVRQQIRSRSYSQSLPKVVLLGLPNAGKSSLFNALTGSEDAITSAVAGTTRDFVARRVSIGPTRIELIDTAGHEDADNLEPLAELMRRQTEVATQDADLCLWCQEAGTEADELHHPLERQIPPERLVRVITKEDQSSHPTQVAHAVVTSSHLGTGLDQLKQVIGERLEQLELARGEMVPATAVRALGAVEATLAALSTAREGALSFYSEELVAAELRVAISHLAEVVGAVYTDDLLDVIFSRFCIGK